MNKQKQNLAAIAILAVIYFIAGKLGLRLALVHPNATAVWAPTGIALAAFLLLGFRVWPGILLGAFLVNLTTAGSIVTSVGIAIGNTLEGLLGAYLVDCFARGRRAIDRAQDILKFSVLAGMVSTTVSATIGVTTLSLAGFAQWNHFSAIWSTWWLGDTAGALVVAPLLLLWSVNLRIRWHWNRALEAAALLLSLVLVGLIVFGGLLSPMKNYPLEFLCVPFLIWAAYRFEQREAATAVALLSGISIWGTLHNVGPFVRQSQNESLLLLEAFMSVTAVMTLTLSASISERKRAEVQIRHLAVSDPLTGLANYRKLIDALDGEIKRFGRTERPFSVLLLDLDGLKKINDRFGHLVGSRALCRLADVLRANCRATDVAARYGGDEFALILPETGREGAKQLASRIDEQLGSGRDSPRLSASIGVALYPEDGQTIEQLLNAADGALYIMKRRPLQKVTSLAHKPRRQARH